MSKGSTSVSKQPPTDPKKTSKPSYSQAAGGIKIGIVHSNYPEETLTTEQLMTVQESIMDQIMGLEARNTINPSFNSSHLRPGWLALVAKNAKTVEWLKSVANNIKPNVMLLM